MSKKLTIQVKGKDWNLRLWSNAVYIKKFGDDSGAVTFPDSKEINFIRGDLSLGVIRHELLHAFVAESNTESAYLDPDQTEELAASIIEFEWNNIQALSEHILTTFLKENKNGRAKTTSESNTKRTENVGSGSTTSEAIPRSETSNENSIEGSSNSDVVPNASSNDAL